MRKSTALRRSASSRCRRTSKPAGPARVVLASDSGSYVLAPPVEALREWLVMVAGTGVSEEDVRVMVADNPGWLFKVPGFETGE